MKSRAENYPADCFDTTLFKTKCLILLLESQLPANLVAECDFAISNMIFATNPPEQFKINMILREPHNKIGAMGPEFLVTPLAVALDKHLNQLIKVSRITVYFHAGVLTLS